MRLSKAGINFTPFFISHSHFPSSLVRVPITSSHTHTHKWLNKTSPPPSTTEPPPPSPMAVEPYPLLFLAGSRRLAQCGLVRFLSLFLRFFIRSFVFMSLITCWLHIFSVFVANCTYFTLFIVKLRVIRVCVKSFCSVISCSLVRFLWVFVVFSV